MLARQAATIEQHPLTKAYPDMLAGGMDSKLCFWRKGMVRSITLDGHAAPISALAALPDAAAVLSASYDKSLRVWSTATAPPRPAGELTGHAAPVLQVRHVMFS